MSDYIMWAQQQGWPNWLISILPGFLAGLAVGCLADWMFS